MEQAQFSEPIEVSVQLQISIKDSRLYLHAQNLQDNTKFALELESTVARMTKNQFPDAQSMGQAFQETPTDASPDFKLSFHYDGRRNDPAETSENKITFDFQGQKVPKDLDISLEWKPETLENELEKVKLLYQKELANVKLKYEEKISRLEQMVLEGQEKNVKMQAEYEAKLSRVKKGTPPVPAFDQFAPKQIRFRRDTPLAANFEFSDNDKTAKLVQLKEKQILKCYPKVPRTGKHTFSLKVNQMKSWVGFGITTKEGDEEKKGGKERYFYFIGDGMLAKKDFKTKNTIWPVGEKNSIVDMMVDMNARDLVFYVDGKQVRSCKLNMEKEEYIVVVYFANREDSVTLLYCS